MGSFTSLASVLQPSQIGHLPADQLAKVLAVVLVVGPAVVLKLFGRV
jgi:hypothetical protein